MGNNNLVERTARLEARMDNFEQNILREMKDRKEVQSEMQQSLMKLNQKVWLATGFIICLQIVLQIALKWAFK